MQDEDVVMKIVFQLIKTEAAKKRSSSSSGNQRYQAIPIQRPSIEKSRISIITIEQQCRQHFRQHFRQLFFRLSLAVSINLHLASVADVDVVPGLMLEY